MKKEEKNFYLVDLKILPEAIKKTIRVKELLRGKEASSINEAVRMVNMSRSAYYKYKDHVASLDEEPQKKTILFAVIADADTALLNRVIKKISLKGNEIISCYRSVPIGKRTLLSISVETILEPADLDSTIKAVQRMRGVRSARIIDKGENQ